MAARSACSVRWRVLRSLGMALRAATRPGAPGVGERLAAVPRMIRAALRGEYDGLPIGRLVGMLGAIVYVLSPVDLVPEGLLSVIGLADDALLVTWLAGTLVNDTEAFLAWERGRRPATAAGPQDAPSFGYAAQDAPPTHVFDTVRSSVVR